MIETALPLAIKCKITAYGDAARVYAFKGSYAPEDRESITQDFLIARYNLECAILEFLERERNKP